RRAPGREQRFDEIDPRLDGEDLALGDDAGVAQEWIVRTRRTQGAADVVALQAQGVAEAVRIEGAGDAALDQLVDRQPGDADDAEDLRDLPVRLVVQLLVR